MIYYHVVLHHISIDIDNFVLTFLFVIHYNMNGYQNSNTSQVLTVNVQFSYIQVGTSLHF